MTHAFGQQARVEAPMLTAPQQEPLPGGLREELAVHLGDVGIAPTAAAPAAAGDGAGAVTIGEDVALGDTVSQPMYGWGRELSAHELTHIVQQRGSVGGPPLSDNTSTQRPVPVADCAARTASHGDGRENSRSPGEALSLSVRHRMESLFGHDFSRVRVHADEADAATSAGARAFTVGHDIVFGRGEFAPETVQGRRLLAHELTHVLQQRAGVQVARGDGQEEASERQANIVSEQVASDRSARALVPPPPPGGPTADSLSVPSFPRMQRQAIVKPERVLDAKETAERHRTVAVITIVGHASPRWRSATSAKSRDQNNERLSAQRAQSVRRQVESELRRLLPNQDLVFEYNYSLADPASASADVVLGTEARGSRLTIIEAGKRAHAANDPEMRRVEVNIRLHSTIETDVEEIIESTERRSGATTNWSIMTPGQAGVAVAAKAGGIIILLRNERTQVVGQYLAEYGGLDVGVSLQFAQASFGWSSFETPAPMTFSDFDPSRFEITSGPGISLGVGAQLAWFHFTYFGGGKPVPRNGIQIGGFTAGGIGVTLGGVAYGAMYLSGSPQETTDVPIRSTRQRLYTSALEEASAHRVLFNTESASISSVETDSLTRYLATAVREWEVPEQDNGDRPE